MTFNRTQSTPQSVIAQLVKSSRPRFWVYLLGPYLIGYVASTATLSWSVVVEGRTLLYLLLFTFPANLYLYGVNDIFDRDTDQFNPKKQQQESFLHGHQLQCLQLGVLLSGLLLLIVTALQPNFLSQILMFTFILLATGYSMPPVRLKARPFFDSASNVLYIFPGLLAFAQLTGNLVPLWVIVAGGCWTAAMHLYSAIPDITVDQKARLKTSAVTLGQPRSLLICLALWSIATLCCMMFAPWWVAGLSLIYPFFLLFQMGSVQPISYWYWKYPSLNGFIGLALFWGVVLEKM